MKKSKIQLKSLIKSFLIFLIALNGAMLQGQETLELDNDTLHLKLDLTRGGAINYISISGTTRNIVNIHDEGRYIQQSYYAGLVLDRTADGQSTKWSPWPWNPIQVGDAFYNRAEILEHSISGDTLYTKCIPMLWDMNNMPAEAEMEQWTTLSGNILKVRNKLTVHRTDDIYGEGLARDQEVPAVYPISALSNLYTYFGESPFANEPLSNPEVINLSSGFWGSYNDKITENWMAFVDDDNWGIGVYTPISTSFHAGMHGIPGGESLDASTSYIAPRVTEALNKNSVFEYEYYLVVGSLDQIRSEIYTLKGVPEYSWEFNDDLEGWSLNPNGGSVAQQNGNMEFTVSGDDPYVYKDVSNWTAGDNQHLWLRIKNSTAGNGGEFSIFPESGDPVSIPVSLTPNASDYEDIMLDMNTIGIWTPDLVVDLLRLDPVNSNSAGIVLIDKISFLENLLEVSSEDNARSITGIGNTLQFYANQIPGYEPADVNWIVDSPTVATINDNGLLTAVAEGTVIVTASAQDGSGDTESISIKIESGGQKNHWEFDTSTDGWSVNPNPNGGNVSWLDGTLNFEITGADPYVYNYVDNWTVGELKYLWMRIKNETADFMGSIYYFFGDEHTNVGFPLTPNDTEFKDIFIDMTAAATWQSDLILKSIRLDPNNNGNPGNIYVDFIRFLEELVEITSEGNATEIIDLGNTLQLYANVVVSDEAIGVDWSVDNEAVATIDATGMLTSVGFGDVIVSATTTDGTNFSGTKTIKVSPTPVEVASITVNSDAAELNGSRNTMQMSVDILPADATDKSVSWSVSNTAIAGINATGLLIAYGNGTVTVTATANDGSGVTGTKDIVVLVTSIDNVEFGDLNIYPNPVSDKLNISCSTMIKSVSIIDITGNVSMETTNISSQMSIDTKELDSGLYLIKITSLTGNISIHKFMKQ